MTLAILAMLGQSVAAAYGACIDMQPADATAGECHSEHDMANHAPAGEDGDQCEHGCDGLCSGSTASAYPAPALNDDVSRFAVAQADSPLAPRTLELLFRPPIRA